MALKDEHHQRKKIKTSYFPNEIILEILIRLPVKSILLCKSICKLWHSIISDPHFIKSHLSLSTCNINFACHRLIINDNTNGSFNSYPLYDVVFEKSINEFEPCFPLEVLTRLREQYYLKVIGSCNGLLCILRSYTPLIYNPSTRKWRELPKVPDGMMHGFGYDESTDDYKVVVITEGSKVMIYSSKTGTWKKTGDFLHGHLFISDNYQSRESGKYLNGALHWASGTRNLFFEPMNLWTIVSLDLAKETCREVLQPVYGEGKRELSLGVLGQWLCVLCNYCNRSRLDVWVMKVYGVKDSWTKLVSIPYQNNIRWPDSVVPLCISNDGKLLLQLGSELVVYDIHNSSSTQISQNFKGVDQMRIIVESLVSQCFP